ncbi:MAG: pilus assembly protein TadD, partial [Mesorhizobium sp.]
MLINGLMNTGKRLITTVFMAALAASVAGCGTSKLTTGSIVRSDSRPLETMSASELHSATARLGESYARNPNDKRIATNFAAALQMDGDADQSLAVMRKLAIALPKDRDVLAAYGKALAANGQFEPALDAVRRAQTPEYPDWRLVSAEAAILDQLGQRDEAR